MQIISQPHCQQCGRTDYEAINCGDQGYTACCNEVVIWTADECGTDYCSHP